MAKAKLTVDDFIAALDSPLKGELEEFRRELLKADSLVTEHIKWNAPSFCYRGDDRVTLRFPPKGGLQLIFHRGVKTKDATNFSFADPTGSLVWAAKDRGVMTLAPGQKLATKELVMLALKWMKETTESTSEL